MKSRNLTAEEVKKFKIGFVTNNQNTFEEFSKNFDKKILKETGLFYFDDKKNKFIERFKDRVIFPINNISGDPIGLGGRTIKSSSYLAKYINSPETPFFKKGSNLYNLDKARKLSNKEDFIYLVEGYMDVIGLYQHGVKNAVASSGTAFTQEQLRKILSYTNSIFIVFDGDEAGYKASWRAVENALPIIREDTRISFIFLNPGEDPDSFITVSYTHLTLPTKA